MMTSRHTPPQDTSSIETGPLGTGPARTAPLNTIVVPIDFSDTSREALQLARTIARRSQAQLHLLHVVPCALRQPWVTEAPGVDYLAIEDRWRRDAQVQLEQLAADEGLREEEVTVVVLAGQPSQTILHYAEEIHADLVVMGAHGQSAVVRFFLGSVAERTVRHSRIPVLTVPRGAAAAAA